jgi:hypothetical protein
MVYSFARIAATLSMKVEDIYSERRRLWVRLREKGGKRHEMPYHNLETYLTAYLEKTGIADDLKGPYSALSGAALMSSLARHCPRPTPT